jgi:hypothetical protein
MPSAWIEDLLSVHQKSYMRGIKNHFRVFIATNSSENKNLKEINPFGLVYGRGAGTRTLGLQTPSLALYQLSYTPNARSLAIISIR